jgi:Fe-S oxidoreductase
MPGIMNFLTQTPLISNISKTIAGIAQKRILPKFAQQTFRNWFNARRKKNTGKPKVILWLDTFNNFFKPETLVAGAEVLEAAGYQVIVSKRPVCCGRPLYDFGMLNTAKKMLLQILDVLREEIREGTPLVGLEPSCVAVFRDEMCDILPFDEDAKRLKQQTYTLAEFLVKKADHFKIPALKRKAIIQGHCHQKAIMKMDCEEELFKEMQMDAEVLDSGCCGMAGYFGYEKGDKYNVSVRAGERMLLPIVRKADNKTIVIADGFSCREQIEQLTDRKGLHTAQVLQMALHQNGEAGQAPINYPEKKYIDGMKLYSSSLFIKRTVIAFSLIGIVSVGYILLRKKPMIKIYQKNNV